MLIVGLLSTEVFHILFTISQGLQYALMSSAAYVHLPFGFIDKEWIIWTRRT